MINILLVEDEPDKIQNISQIIDPFLNEKIILDVVHDINAAKRILSKKNIDIMILDIYLPRIFGEKDQLDGGIRLLDEIRRSTYLAYPKYVVSLSRHEDATKIFEQASGNIHKAIYYNVSDNKWERELVSCLETAIAVLANDVVHRSYDYDIAVICALKEEIDIIKDSLNGVEKLNVAYDNELYYTGYYVKGARKVRVVISFARQMGMVAATALATKIINNFTPRYLFMTGITGGIYPEKTNYGDIIAASYSWDYRSGKDKREGDVAIHLNSPKPCNGDSILLDYCRHLQNDYETLKAIKRSFDNGAIPASELKLAIGPVASGASVVTDPQIVADIVNNQDRDTLGVEMEIYGVYYAATWAMEPKPKVIALKSVSDFADIDKGDTYHPYASYTSAKAFEVLALQYLKYGDENE